MKWKSFNYEGNDYDLSHLHPYKIEMVQPSTSKNEEKTYTFDIVYSMHCFTNEIKSGDDPLLLYKDNRERRTFCFKRYQLSQNLPSIVNQIHKKKCSHTGMGNFFIVEITTNGGDSVEYEIYFDVKLGAKKNLPLRLYIQSAYVRSEENKLYRHKNKKVGFFIIAYNRKNSKPLKTPR